MEKPTILVLTGGYVPARRYGGPVISIKNIVEHCSDSFKFKIITRDHDLGENKRFPNINYGWNSVGKAEVLYLSDRQCKFNNIVKILEETDYDMIYLNSFFAAAFAVPALYVAKKMNKPILLSPRGELCENAFKMKMYKKKPYTYFMNTFGLLNNVWWHSTSDDETEGIKGNIKSSHDKIIQVHNLPSTPPDNIRKLPKHNDVLYIVFNSRINQKKNLLEAIRVVNQLKYKVEFHIYGPCEDTLYWNECKKLITQSPFNINIKYFGLIDHSQVYETLSKYDVFFLPTRSENYGHAIVEAMQIGCPVIISDQTPWLNLETVGAGYTIPLNDKDGFIKALNKIASMDNKEYANLVKQTKKYIEKEIAICDSINIYGKMFMGVIDSFYI